MSLSINHDTYHHHHRNRSLIKTHQDISTLIIPSYALLFLLLMGMAPRFNFLLHAFLCLALATISFSFSPKFYDIVYPQALLAIKKVVEVAVRLEPWMGASLLRLHFYDCFVNLIFFVFWGSDGLLLLDSSSTFEIEKNARGNFNSVRGFEVVDQIKAEVARVCGRLVVSCVDILAVAQDSVVILGGSIWKVRLGRRDSTIASRALADNRRATCPRTSGNTNLALFDPTPARFDTAYFKNLVKERGLLTSDQAVLNGGSTDKLVETYNKNRDAFWVDFGKSMIKIGNIRPLIRNQGQIRVNCRKVN
ncbi:hypothetical protein CXB51_017202 [Gossypium anomalum]|uniref:Peroxidase n=1 Tax=Gossypium anomalum TaxID=47600 RepID=A0A8J5YN61_9ROSI|nr:hypothetical protein CXB51_017202 [Gossypium anomalum]